MTERVMYVPICLDNVTFSLNILLDVTVGLHQCLLTPYNFDSLMFCFCYSSKDKLKILIKSGLKILY